MLPTSTQEIGVIPDKTNKPFKLSGVDINSLFQGSYLLLVSAHFVKQITVSMQKQVPQERTMFWIEQLDIKKKLQKISQFSSFKPSPRQQNSETYKKHHSCKVVQRWSITLSLLFHGPINKEYNKALSYY